MENSESASIEEDSNDIEAISMSSQILNKNQESNRLSNVITDI